MKNRMQWLLLVGTLLMTGCAPVMSGRMDQMIETAKTQADHEALATHYEQEAKMLQKKAEEHRHMARVYGVLPYGAPKSAINFAQHCNAVASQLEAAAEENLELAKMHRQIAAEAPG